MKTSLKSVLMVMVLLAGSLSLSTTASADLTAPFLYSGGNYAYDAGTHSLTFSGNFVDLVEYTDGSYSTSDPIANAPLSFGSMTNGGANPLVFSPSTLTVAGYFSATLAAYVAPGNISQIWGSLSDITRLDGGASQFVTELIANGGKSGGIVMAFTPNYGSTGIESFTVTGDGSLSTTVGVSPVPLPPSAALLFSGLASLAFSRRKRISGR